MKKAYIKPNTIVMATESATLMAASTGITINADPTSGAIDGWSDEVATSVDAKGHSFDVWD